MPKITIPWNHREPVQESIRLLLQTLDGASRDGLDEESKKALDGLITELQQHNVELQSAISTAKTSGMEESQYNEAVSQFSSRCEESINKYTPQLMGVPNLWDKLKEKIEDFLDKHAKLKQDFDKVAKSGFEKLDAKFKSKDTGFRSANPEALEAFKKTKESLHGSNQAEDEEYKPEGPQA